MAESQRPESSRIELLESELTTIVRKQLWIGVTTVFALSLLVVLLFMDHRGWVVVAVILLISVKKAFVQYRDLGKRKVELLQELQSE